MIHGGPGPPPPPEKATSRHARVKRTLRAYGYDERQAEDLAGLLVIQWLCGGDGHRLAGSSCPCGLNHL